MLGSGFRKPHPDYAKKQQHRKQISQSPNKKQDEFASSFPTFTIPFYVSDGVTRSNGMVQSTTPNQAFQRKNS
jgi:hypothetical protein